MIIILLALLFSGFTKAAFSIFAIYALIWLLIPYKKDK